MPRRFGSALVDPQQGREPMPAGPQGLPSAPRSHYFADPTRPFGAGPTSGDARSGFGGFGQSPSAWAQPRQPDATSRSVGASGFGAGVTAGLGGVDLSKDPGQDGLVPQLGLPKGGGALRGIGERFDVAAFTGTGGLTIPVYTSPGRGGSGPTLTLSYDSGAGQGPFGLGMRLSPPSISRRTDRGLPRYADREESDTFVWSGADHLVPGLELVGSQWQRVERTEQIDGVQYRVFEYRPRVESGFARIERWQPLGQPSFWRVTDGNNVTSTYGRTAQARIANPQHGGMLVFAWLLERVEDDRGNVTVYEYAAEDVVNVDMRAPWEVNRARENLPNGYLKRIRYGNRTPGADDDFMFEVVFDYGEHGELPPATEEHTEGLAVAVDPVRAWTARRDPFSNFRARFEIRTYRRCQRVLMVHRFPELNSGAPTVVASTDLYYDDDPVGSRLMAATHRGYLRNPDGLTYTAQAAPPLELEYQPRQLGSTQRVVDTESVRDLGAGLDADHLQLVDLDGEGLPGLLYAAGDGGWRYKRPLGSGRFGGAVLQPTVPSIGMAPVGPRLLDLDGDGHLSLAVFEGPTPGTQERTEDRSWGRHRAFLRKPNVPIDDARTRFVDLDGDGLADLLVDRGETLLWYRSLGRDGYGDPVTVPRPGEGPDAPQRIYSDPTVGLFFADMTGDGLSDLVVVRNGSVAYWPNMGLGHFGKRVSMPGLSVFDRSGMFSASRVRLGDIDGSGTSDLVYFDSEGARVWINASGNRFVEETRVHGFPRVDNVTHAELADLTGTGTADLVWSSSLAMHRGEGLRYVELQPGGKPYLLIGFRNNMGRETRIAYASSTRFYLQARDSARPWKTRLAFPVQVVERVEVMDHVTGQRYVSTYAYHHGYFDGAEREFRGFGLVEQRDTETFEHFGEPGLFPTGHRVEDQTLHVPPILTRTWFQTGAYVRLAGGAELFADEYWRGDPDAPPMPTPALPREVSSLDRREALRALRGQMLRQEVYAEDGTPQAGIPYAVVETRSAVRRLQPRVRETFGSFLVIPHESRTLHYERNASDPRLQQELTLEVDEYGVPTRTAAVGYPRRTPEYPEQAQTAIVVTEVEVQHQVAAPTYRIGTPIEQRSYELRGLVGNPRTPLTVDALRGAIEGATRVSFETPAGGVDLRLLSRRYALYYADDLGGALPRGQAGQRALPYEARAQAFSDEYVETLLGAGAAPESLADILSDGGYELEDGDWFVRSGRAIPDISRFYVPTQVQDPFGNVARIEYDPHTLFPVRLTDPVDNVVSVEPDYRTLAPWRSTDPNGSVTELGFDALGQVVRFASVGNPDLAEGDTLADPTATFEVNLFAFHRDGSPVVARTRNRERHRDPNTRWLEQYTYSDGGGNLVQAKARAESGDAFVRDEAGNLLRDDNGDLVERFVEERWVGTGRVIRNNKGLPIKQYEPFFSDRPDYESDAAVVELGVTPLLRYDPLGRAIRTDLPNGTFSRVEFTPWRATTFDPNDTVLQSAWYADASAAPGNSDESRALRRAATVTEHHANTPSVVHLDHLGRAFLSDEHNRRPDGSEDHRLTRAELDIQGNVVRVIDARGNEAEAREYGMLGQPLVVRCVDAGERRAISDATGGPLRAWNSRGFATRMRFDAGRRPTHQFVRFPDGGERLVQRMVYGEQVSDAVARHLRGQLFRVYDGAGARTNEAFDFEGNLARQTQTLAVTVADTPDWSPLPEVDDPEAVHTAALPLLEPETFELTTTHDALGRPVQQRSPGGTVVQLGYNAAALLESVHARVRGAEALTPVVEDIDYNARGQRTLVVHGNGTQTTYAYDPQTFRLTRLRTTRGERGRLFQDLYYTYDAVGNPTEILDRAQPDTYFNGDVVEGRQTFVYDAVYQLVEATGREHAQREQPTHEAFGPLPNPQDGTALRRYLEGFDYDLVGNILRHQHTADGGNWTRQYEYAANGNRLLGTSAPADPEGVLSHRYSYDAHGSMTSMPHLPEIRWDWADRMQAADLTGGGRVYFAYDAGGARIRKRRVAGTRTEDRIYIGPFELYRERVNGTLRLERETLHIGDDSGRACMLETRTVRDGGVVANPSTVFRFQYSNHLGSATLELTETAELISYEEYYPYGTTAYEATNSAVDVSSKRYRFTGLEHDEETGLQRHGARYYARWLGRWVGADPLGSRGGVNRFSYAWNNPSGWLDETGLLGEPALDPKKSYYGLGGRVLPSARPTPGSRIPNAYPIGDTEGSQQDDPTPKGSPPVRTADSSSESKRPLSERLRITVDLTALLPDPPRPSLPRGRHHPFHPAELAPSDPLGPRALLKQASAAIEGAVDPVSDIALAVELGDAAVQSGELGDGAVAAGIGAIAIAGVIPGGPDVRIPRVPSRGTVSRSRAIPLGSEGGINVLPSSAEAIPLPAAPRRIVPTGDVDPAADALAASLGGNAKSSVRIEGFGNREFDLVTDDFIGQTFGPRTPGEVPTFSSRPKNFLGKSRRSQIRETLRAAKETGRAALFEFRGGIPDPSVLEFIRRNADRAGVAPLFIF